MDPNNETLLRRIEESLARLEALAARVRAGALEAGPHVRHAWARLEPDLDAELSREHPVSAEAADRLEAEVLRVERFLAWLQLEALGTQPPSQA